MNYPASLTNIHIDSVFTELFSSAMSVFKDTVCTAVIVFVLLRELFFTQPPRILFMSFFCFQTKNNVYILIFMHQSLEEKI